MSVAEGAEILLPDPCPWCGVGPADGSAFWAAGEALVHIRRHFAPQ